MSDERIDPETLAAFLEGGLPPAERARVMRVLAESPDEYGQFVEAAAVQRELAPPLSIVPRARRGRYVAPVLIAAGLVGLFIARRTTNESPATVVALVQDVRLARSGADVASSLGAAWDQPAWSVVRGGGADLGDRARAFRAGVRYTELEIAAQAGDSAAVARASESLAEAAATIDAGAPVGAEFRASARSSDGGGAATRARSAGQLRALLGAPGWFDAGAWIETARLAIAANQLSFFAVNGPADAELKRIIVLLESQAERRSEASLLIDALRPLASGRSWSAADSVELSRIIDAAMAAGAR